MFIICGLGNPGKQYELSRHNMGFLTVDVLAGRLGIAVNKLKFKALLGEGSVGGEKVLLVKPQTFMNLSGESLREIMAYYKEDTARLLVIYDDIDIPAGSLRIRPSGSAGTHNGMRSIIYQLQKDDFPRIRVGVGKNGQIPLDKYVLGKPSDSEMPLIKDAIIRASEAAEMFVREGIANTMTKFNANAGKGEKADASKSGKKSDDN